MKLLSNYPKFDSVAERVAYKTRQRQRLQQQLDTVNYADLKVAEIGLSIVGGIFAIIAVGAILATMGVI